MALAAHPRPQTGISINEVAAEGTGEVSVDAVTALVDTVVVGWEARIPAGIPGRELRINRIAQLREYVCSMSDAWALWHDRILAMAGAAVATAGRLPEKKTPVLKPLMKALRRERYALFRGHAASAVAHLVTLCGGEKPAPQVLKNLGTMLCSDPEVTPVIAALGGDDVIRTLQIDREVEEAQRAARGRGGRKAASIRHLAGGEAAAAAAGVAAAVEAGEGVSAAFIGHLGGAEALRALATAYGARLVTDLPAAWRLATVGLEHAPIVARDCGAASTEGAQSLVHALQGLHVLGPALAPDLEPVLLAALRQAVDALQYPCAAVRYKAAQCLTAVARRGAGPVLVLELLVVAVLPWLGDAEAVTRRRGAAELLLHIVRGLELEILPYLVILVTPVLGRMSDFDSEVRTAISSVFAGLMTLMPLEARAPDPPGMSAPLVERRKTNRRFLEQLLDPTKLERYSMPRCISATLRSYQQAGLDWMNFLYRYQLHGVLCDDMGLGKTLQSICMMAGSHVDRAALFARTGDPAHARRPSLVVCPSTLTAHWEAEVQKWCAGIEPLQYAGPKAARLGLRRKVAGADIIIMSYDTLRAEVAHWRQLRFNYCVLDEGHLIKNPKSAVSTACRAVQADHRLILSGTPIQNNVLELWALFDFLMPGFLGTQTAFQSQYGRPIQRSKDPKATEADVERGTAALERLHRQVLPFLLRRMKEDVLDDLPPKIIQDYPCELTDVQLQLYDDFAQKQVARVAAGGGAAKGQIFQALRFAKLLCVHPAQVLTPAHALHGEISAQLAREGTSIGDVVHSGKLQGLLDLLRECGIGADEAAAGGAEDDDALLSATGPQHRCLLFAQSTGTLDLVESLVLPQLNGASHLRLDGTIPASRRQGYVALHARELRPRSPHPEAP